MEHVHEHTQHAASFLTLAAVVLAGTLSGALGPYLVWRRMGLVGDAISHASLIVVAIALALGLPETSLLIPFAIVFALLLSFFESRKFKEIDSVIAIFFSGFMAIGLLIMNVTGVGSEEVLHVLFGEIAAVSSIDLGWLFALNLVVGFYLWRFRRELRLSLVQPDLAKIQNIKVRLHSRLLFILLSVSVVVCIKIMGVVLVTALLVTPAMIALTFANSARSHALISIGLGGALGLLGHLIAEGFHWPVSPTIAALSFFVFLISASLRARR